MISTNSCLRTNKARLCVGFFCGLIVPRALKGAKRLIGDRIRHLRIHKGITQESLAKQLHISPQAVSKWEQNISTPDVSVLVPLSDYFGVTVDYLLRNTEVLSCNEISSLLEIKIHKDRKASAFTGYVKNSSHFKISALDFKVKFKNAAGCVIDYREESVYNLDPAEMKQIITFTQVAKEVTDTEIEILKYCLL